MSVMLWANVPEEYRRSDATAERQWTKEHSYYDRISNTRANAPTADFLRCEAAASLSNFGRDTTEFSKRWTRCPLLKAPHTRFCSQHDKRWWREHPEPRDEPLMTFGWSREHVS